MSRSNVVPYDRALNTAILDLATHPVDAWAVIYHGKLLPVRFSTEDQAFQHLREMIREDERTRRSVAA